MDSQKIPEWADAHLGLSNALGIVVAVLVETGTIKKEIFAELFETAALERRNDGYEIAANKLEHLARLARGTVREFTVIPGGKQDGEDER